MKMKNACALIMAAAMVVSGGSPMLLFAETSQSADTSLSDQSAVKAAWDPLPRTVNLVQEDGYTAGIKDPAVPTSSTMSWAANGDASWLYFGNYYYNDGQTKQPLKWRVLDSSSPSDNATEDSFLLMTDQIVDRVLYNENINTYQVRWPDSNLRKWLNSEQYSGSYTEGGFLNNAFDEVEQSAVKTTTWPDTGNFMHLDTPAVNEKVFLLAAREMDKAEYGFYHYGISGVLQSTTRMTSTPYARAQGVAVNSIGFSNYYLRSVTDPGWGEGYYIPGMVGVDGSYFSETAGMLQSGIQMFNDFDIMDISIAGVAPVVHIGWDSVLFVSEHSSEKPGIFQPTAASDRKDWDVTLLNDDNKLNAKITNTASSVSVHAGDKLQAEVSGVDTERGYDRISAMLVNSSGSVVAYGAISSTAQDGEYQVPLPEDLKEGSYTLKIFAEKVGYGTEQAGSDYASHPVDIPVKIIPEEDGPALSASHLGSYASVYGDDMSEFASTLVIENVGNVDAEIESVKVTPEDRFEVSATGDNTVTAGGTNTSWKISPKAGISRGVNDAVVTISYRRGMELIETTAGMRMTVSPKPVTVTVAAKPGVEWEQDETEPLKLHMWATLIWEEEEGYYNSWDTNWAKLKDDDPTNDDEFDENWDGPMQATYEGIDGETKYATVLYNYSTYFEYPTGLHPRRYQLNVEVSDPNYILTGLEGFTTLDFNWGEIDGVPQLPTTPPPAVQDFWINYNEETVTLLVSDAGVKVHLANTKEDFSGTMIYNGDSITEYINDAGEERTVLYLQTTADAAGVASASTPVKIPLRREAPEKIGSEKTSGPGRSDGALTGLTTDMEYRKQGETAWTSVIYPGKVTGLSAGTYEVRYKAQVDDQARWDKENEKLFNNEFASASAEVVIDDDEASGAILNIEVEDPWGDGLAVLGYADYGADYAELLDTVEVTVTNSGTDTGTISDISSTGGNFGWLNAENAVKEIAPGVSETYTVGLLPDAGAGQHNEYVVVKYDETQSVTDNEVLLSVNIRKASQAKPAAPAKDTVTSTSITLKPGDESGKGTANYGLVKDGTTTWQESPTFTGLNPDTEYSFKIKFSGDTNYNASPESDTVTIRTAEAEQYEMAVSNMELAPVVYGESPVATAISLKNTGASQLTGVTITAVSGETDSFVITEGNTTIRVSSTDESWKIAPKESLGAGNHEVTLRADSAETEPQEFTVTLTVEKAEQTAPDAPSAETVSARSITLEAQTSSQSGVNAQYRMRKAGMEKWGDWQSEVEFADLTPNVKYEFEAYYPETENYKISEGSDIAEVTTKKAALSVDGNLSASGEYGISLSELKISSENVTVTDDQQKAVNGSWAWEKALSGDERPVVNGTKNYTAVFTPAENADQYEAVTQDVLPVITAKSVVVTVKGDAAQDISNITGLQAEYEDVDGQVQEAVVLYNGKTDLPKTPGSYTISVQISDTNYAVHSFTGPETFEINDSVLNEAKKNAQAVIQDLEYLSTEKKQEYLTQIADAVTVSDVEDIVESAEQENAAEELSHKKQEAKKEIEGLVNLSETQKTQYKTSVDNAQTVQAVEEALTAAKAADAAALTAKKEAANAEIEELTNLTEEHKAEYKTRVEEAETIAAVDEILAEAKAADQAAGDAAALEAKKEEVKTAIDELQNLTDEQKTEYKSQVEEANDIEEVETTLEAAKAADAAALTAKKEAANAEIEALTNLTEEQRQEYKSQVEKAETIAAIDDIMTKAKEADQAAGDAAALEAEREEAQKAIDGLQNLTDLQKADYKAQVEAADSISAVQEIVVAAQMADGAAALRAKKESAKTAIAGLPNLTEIQKSEYESQVEAAQSISEVQEVLQTAQAADTAALETRRTEVAATISNLTYLTDEQKQAYADRVSSAATIKEIDTILSEAQEENITAAETLEQAKESANAALMGLKYLSDERMLFYQTKISEAQNVDVVSEILAEANAENARLQLEEQLRQKKETAKNELGTLIYLDAAAQQNYKDQIDAALTMEAVDTLLAAARQENASLEEAANLNEAKVSAKARINALEYLSEQTKQAYTAQIDAAASEAELAIILDAAIAENSAAQTEAVLTAAKEQANVAIHALAGLSAQEKSQFVSQIRAAQTVEEVQTILAAAEQKSQENLASPGSGTGTDTNPGAGSNTGTGGNTNTGGNAQNVQDVQTPVRTSGKGDSGVPRTGEAEGRLAVLMWVGCIAMAVAGAAGAVGKRFRRQSH